MLCRCGADSVAGTSWGEPKRITAVRYSQLKKKAVSVTNAHFLRANAQQRVTIRQDTSSTGTASPSKGMMVEFSGWQCPERDAMMVTTASANVVAISIR